MDCSVRGSTTFGKPAPLSASSRRNLALVLRILGHASITTTANEYGHLTDAMLGKAAERIDTISRGSR